MHRYYRMMSAVARQGFNSSQAASGSASIPQGTAFPHVPPPRSGTARRAGHSRWPRDGRTRDGSPARGDADAFARPPGLRVPRGPPRPHADHPRPHFDPPTHTMKPIALETKTAVAILKNPLDWGENSTGTRIVFLLAVGKGDQKGMEHLYDLLVRIIEEQSLQKELLEAHDFESLHAVLSNVL